MKLYTSRTFLKDIEHALRLLSAYRKSWGACGLLEMNVEKNKYGSVLAQSMI